MIDVVEIWAGVNSDVAAKAEKTTVSIIWGRHNFLVREVVLAVFNRVDQECLDGRFAAYVGCFESLTDCLPPAMAAHSISTRFIT